MKAAVYRGPRTLSYEDVPDPVVGPHDLLVEIAACGICGSDLHSYAAGWAADGDILGHEYSGEVIAVGAEVTKHAVGDRVAVIPTVPCGACFQCAADRQNLCEHPRRGESGGYAELTALPDEAVSFTIPDEMSLEEAVFLEPLAVAVRAVNRARLSPGDPVVVLGLGSIGLNVLQVLKAHGVTPVIAADISPQRLEMARSLGADVVIDPTTQDLAAELRARLGSSRHRMYEFSRAQVVFECTGAVPVLGQAIEHLVVAGGTVVMVALFERDVSFDAKPLVRKEVSLVGSYAYARADWEEAFELLARRRVDVLRLVSDRVPLAEIDAAFARQLAENRSVKILVEP